MIPDNYKPIRQVGNGKTTSFSFDFPMLSENFIKVYREKDGIQELVDPSEYVWGYLPVEGDEPAEDLPPENVITFYEAPEEGTVIVIAREIPLEQTTPYKTSSGFPAVRVEDNFDKLTAITQQLMEEVDRCVKVEITGDQTSEELLAEVYGKLDSATEVAQEAVDAATAATEAVASAEKTLADVTTYVDTSKTEIDALITKTTDEIDKTIEEATEEIKAAAVAEAEKAIDAGVKAIEDKAIETTEGLDDAVNKARIWAEGEQAEVKPLGGELSSMGAADLAYALANAPEDTPIDASGLFAMNVVKGEKGDKGDKGEDGKDGGGLEIGDVAFAVMGIDETKNLRRYLNGQVISQSQFVSFTNWVKERAKLYPNVVATEENWQATVTNSKLGQCGKFVIDDTLGTIRLPKVVNIQGLQDLSLLGGMVEAGLPDVSFRESGGDITHTLTGGPTHVKTGEYGVEISLSELNPIYGNSDTVQQEAIQYPYFIQVATGVEESVDVTREIELNNPFSLLDYKWSEYEITNASWLLSNGAFHSGTVYKAVYELLLKIKNGTETKDGVSVKLSTEAYEDTDFVLNTADTTFRLPIKVKLASGNAVVGNGMTLGLTDGDNNLGLMGRYNSTAGSRLDAQVSGYGIDIGKVVSNTTAVKELKTVGVTTDPAKSGIETSSSGLKLYFYVGETIQDANVINAGGVLTRVAELSNEYIVGLGMPDYSAGVSVDFPLPDTPYTVPYDGLYVASFQYGNHGDNLYINGVKSAFHVSSPTQYRDTSSVTVPLSKGDVIYWGAKYTGLEANIFYPLKGVN